MCKNSHIIDSSYEWYLKVNDLVDELYACQRSRSSECKQGGQKRRRESTVNESSIIAPPPRFELLPSPVATRT